MAHSEVGIGCLLEGCRSLSLKLTSDPVVDVVESEQYFSFYPAHHPWQLRSDPAAPFPPLLPGACANLWWGQAGEPEPEEGGDRCGESGAAAFRYQAWPDSVWGALEVDTGDMRRQLSRPPDLYLGF